MVNCIDVQTQQLKVIQCIENYEQAINLYADGNISTYGLEGIFEQTTPPTNLNNALQMLWFNPTANVWKYTEDGGVTWNHVELLKNSTSKKLKIE